MMAIPFSQSHDRDSIREQNKPPNGVIARIPPVPKAVTDELFDPRHWKLTPRHYNYDHATVLEDKARQLYRVGNRLVTEAIHMGVIVL